MRKKTLILGIDSGCWEYLDPLLEQGRLPNIAALAQRGVRGVLESTMPPITPVAFSSFITGVNPGQHGIFDWSVRRDDGQGFQPASASCRRGVPFWHYLNQSGVRVGLFNIPMTYPPQPLDGFIVAGISVPRTSRSFTYPAEVLDFIESRFGPYQVDVPLEVLREQGIEAYLAAWQEYERRQTDIALALMDEFAVDVLAFNYASLDRINHFAADYAHVEEILVHVDAQIGRFMERFPEANFIIMSDHGSRRVKSAFLLSKWLAQHGYLAYGEKSLDIPRHEFNFVLSRYFQEHLGWNGTGERVVRKVLQEVLTLTPATLRRPLWQTMYRAAPQVFDYRFTDRIDWPRTRAFATSNSGPIFINGPRHGPAYERIRENLIKELLCIEDPISGGRVFQRIYRKEELYQGEAVEWAPDLVADHYSSACDLIVDNDPTTFYFVNRLNRFGDHIRGGLFIFSGPDFVQGNGEKGLASILDLPATLLHLYNVPIPEEYEGRVLSDFLAPDFVRRHPVRRQETGSYAGLEEYEHTDEEMAQLTEHLKGLGYL